MKKKQKQTTTDPFTTAEKKQKRMRRFITAAVVLLVVSIACWWALPKNSSLESSDLFDAEEVKAKAEEVVQLLNAEDYDIFLTQPREGSTVTFKIQKNKQ